MDEQQRTCGQGLAEHSALPAQLAALTAAVAENLELHMKALDLTDESSKKEHAAYRELAKEHRKLAAELQATAEQMAGYRDLPMGRHDWQAMSSPKVREAFAQFVRREEELLALLEKRVKQDREMLVEMAAARSGAS